MKRRDFLKTGGVVGTAGLILDGCGTPQELIQALGSTAIKVLPLKPGEQVDF